MNEALQLWALSKPFALSSSVRMEASRKYGTKGEKQDPQPITDTKGMLKQ